MSDRRPDVSALSGLISDASSEQMEVYFGAAVGDATGSSWLAKDNIVIANGPAKLPRKSAGHPYDGDLLRDVLRYGAMSVMLHTGDSWSYFSRGISAYAAGSLEIAQHLLYYSELRAARALLQRHGIFLFDKNNFIVDQQGKTCSLDAALGGNTATHRATWSVFDVWTKVSAASFMSEQLRYLGRTLDEWKSASPQTTTMDAAISSLVREWGLDLNSFAADRTLRNHLSYDPNRIAMQPLGHSPSTVASCLQDAWYMLEPAGANPFETFDGYLIREIVGRQYAARNPDKGLDSMEFRAEVEHILDDLLPSGAQSGMTDYFCDPTKPALPFLDKANIDPTDDSHELNERLVGMIGRALVLLRMATGAASDLRIRAAVERPKIETWAVDMLVSRGIAVPGGSSRSFVILWDDVLSQLEELDDLTGLGSVEDMPQVLESAQAVSSLTVFERVPAWAVA